jgi:hypothetical protein
MPMPDTSSAPLLPSAASSPTLYNMQDGPVPSLPYKLDRSRSPALHHSCTADDSFPPPIPNRSSKRVRGEKQQQQQQRRRSEDAGDLHADLHWEINWHNPRNWSKRRRWVHSLVAGE